jgi:hypothetical protein
LIAPEIALLALPPRECQGDREVARRCQRGLAALFAISC